MRSAFCEKTIEQYKEPDNPIVARIRAKSRERERRAAESKAKKGGSISESIKTICFMGCGITPFNVGDLPYCALTKLMNIY